MSKLDGFLSGSKNTLIYLFAKKGKTATTIFVLTFIMYVNEYLQVPEFVSVFILTGVINLFANSEKWKRNKVWVKFNEMAETAQNWKDKFDQADNLIYLSEKGVDITQAVKDFKERTKITKHSKDDE